VDLIVPCPNQFEASDFIQSVNWLVDNLHDVIVNVCGGPVTMSHVIDGLLLDRDFLFLHLTALNNTDCTFESDIRFVVMDNISGFDEDTADESSQARYEMLDSSHSSLQLVLSYTDRHYQLISTVLRGRQVQLLLAVGIITQPFNSACINAGIHLAANNESSEVCEHLLPVTYLI